MEWISLYAKNYWRMKDHFGWISSFRGAYLKTDLQYSIAKFCDIEDE